MEKKGFFTAVFLFSIAALFFYKTVFQGLIPFPGDLLVAEYNPWKTYSYLGYVPGSFPNKAQYFDVLRQLYPWKTLSISQLAFGNIPLWNPYNFSGSPLLANFQSAVFYPFNIVYKFFPQILGWSILVILQPFLALFFTFLYARKIGIGKLGAYFSGISFAFSSFMTVWLEYNTIGHVILWLPLILLSIEHLLEKKEIKWTIIFIFSLTSSLFAGHIQVSLYLLLFSIAYFLFRALSLDRKDFKNNLLFFTALIIFSLGLGSVQLIPGLELLGQSARSAHPYDFLINKILIQPWQLIMFFVPDFFGNPATRNYWISDTYIGKVTSIGSVSVFFILLGIFSKKNNIKKFFIWTCFTILLLTTNNPLTLILYKIKIPFVSSSAPTLGIFLFVFGVSILAGLGVDSLQKEKFSFKRYAYLFLPIFILFVVLWLLVFTFINDNTFSIGFYLKTVSVRNLLYSTIVFVIAGIALFSFVFNKKLKYAILVFLLLLNIFDSWRSFQKFNPFSPRESVFPKAQILTFLQKESGINRFWGYGAANIEANFSTEYNLFSPEGYDPLYPKIYGEFIQASKNGKIQTNFTKETRSDANIAQGFGENGFSSNKYRLRALDLLGVKYILDRIENGSTQKTFPKERFKLIYVENGWKVLENTKALPRIFLVSDYKTYNSKEEFEKLFFDENFDPLKTILLEEEVRRNLNDLNHLSNVRLLSYKPNEVRISTSTDGNYILFLSDTYYPGWKAFVDGTRTNIYKADYAFRAVFVPKGEHKVSFVYDPLSFKMGFWISLVSFSLSILFLFAFYLSHTIYKNKSKRQNIWKIKK